jgi:hypothetical protein
MPTLQTAAMDEILRIAPLRFPDNKPAIGYFRAIIGGGVFFLASSVLALHPAPTAIAGDPCSCGLARRPQHRCLGGKALPGRYSRYFHFAARRRNRSVALKPKLATSLMGRTNYFGCP